MEWSAVALGAVICVFLIAFTDAYFKNRPRLKTHLEFREDIAILNGKLIAKDMEITMWKERGDRLSNAYDCATEHLRKLQNQFFKIIADETQIENLKELLKKQKEIE